MRKKKAKVFAKKGKTLRQVGALPYRIGPDGDIEVMLVTSRRKGRFILPKGWKMKGKTKPAAAAQEAKEEAGVIGAPPESSIGRYRYQKRLGSVKAAIFVTIFPICVQRQLSKWPEQRERKRVWVKPSKAVTLIDEPGLAGLVADARCDGFRLGGAATNRTGEGKRASRA
jgi:8-oxo-dGTP pyrophosphatase MutT (NUDIX family)